MKKKVYRITTSQLKGFIREALEEAMAELDEVQPWEGKPEVSAPPLRKEEKTRLRELVAKLRAKEISKEEVEELKVLTARVKAVEPKVLPGVMVEQDMDEEQVMGAAGQKVEKKLDKVPGLDKILGAVRQRGDAAAVLRDIADALGGDKLGSDKILQTALAKEKQEMAKK